MNAARNAVWAFVSYAVRTLTQLGALAVLARLLTPAEFGLVALAAIVLNLAQVIQDMGTSSLVIQKHTLDGRLLSAIYWLNLGTGLALFTVLALLAPLLAAALGQPALTLVLVVLLLGIPLQGATSVHQALLERAHAFRAMAAIEIGGTALGAGVGIVLAWRGLGAFALAAQAVTTAAACGLGFLLASRWRPAALPRRADFAGLWRFGGHVTLFSLLGFVSRNVDAAIVGRALGASAMGFYAQGMRLMMFPLQSVTYVAARALFPVMSRQQGRAAEMAALYTRSLAVIAALTTPMFAGLWLLRGELVAVLLGPRWETVALLLAWLAPTGWIQSIAGTAGTLLKSTGRTGLLLAAGAGGAVLYVGAILVGVRWGIEGACIAYLVATAVNGIWVFGLVLRAVAVPVRGLLVAIQAPLASAAVMLLAGWPALAWSVRQGLAPAVTLVGITALCAAVYGLCLWLFGRQTFGKVRAVLG